MKKISLIKPNEAQGEIAEIFEDIKKTKGEKYLTPTWGFWALDPDLLRHWWGLAKRIQTQEGRVPKRLMHCISLVCAAEVKCPRCVNHHQTHLMEEFKMTSGEVEDLLDFENSHLPANEKAVLRFARNVAFGQEVTQAQFMDLRDFGYDDRAIVEIVTMAFFESSMARHAVTIAQFEDGENWPRENVPSEFYALNIDR